MRTLLFLLTVCLFLASGCGQEQLENPMDRTVLTIGTDATYPPFELVDSRTGTPTGFDIDLVSEVCARNGWTPEFIVTPFDGIIPGLLNNKYDLVISAMTITPERAAVVAFSDPYYLAGQTMAVPVDDTMIVTVEDLRGRHVGVQLGTTGELMAKRMDGVHVFSYDNIGAAFIDMNNGNLDAVLNDFPTTQAYISRHGMARMVGNILSEEHYGMAMRPKDTVLHRQVNDALAAIRSDGTYDSLHVKWFDALPAREVLPDSAIDSTVMPEEQP